MVDGKSEKAVFFFSQLPKRAAANGDGDFRMKGLIEDIVEVTGAEHSRAWYAKTIRLLGPETAGNYVYEALSLTKDADRRGQIKTSKDQFFISTLKRICQGNGFSFI
jgi:hypothetical protein